MRRNEAKEYEEFVRLMTFVADEYAKELTERALLLRWQAVRRFGMDKIEEAIKKHLATSRFFPKISELLDLLQGTGENELADRASLAWDEFINGMEMVGRYQSVRFTDKIVNAIVHEWGGWESVCSLEWDDLKYKRGEFVSLYRALAKRDPKTLPQKCVGLIEGHNAGRWEEFIPNDRIIGRVGARIEMSEGRRNQIGVDPAKQGAESTAIVKLDLEDITKGIGE